MPETLQSDNRKEVKEKVKRFCRMKKIRMVQYRPYNPRAKGKVERSHRALRNKILFNIVTQTWSGTNWAKNLPNYMKFIDNKNCQELGWQSPFEVYFGRKS